MTTAQDRGAGYRPERNVLGGIEELRPAQQFHVIGFDIGAAVLTSTMQKDLNGIAQYVKLRDDVNYHIVITGTASESRIQLVDPVALGQARADAIRDYLVKVGIPRNGILTFSHGAHGAPSANASPEVKAEWRGAFIDITFSGSSRRPAPAPVVPGQRPDPNKDLAGVKVLLPPTKYKDIPKKVREVAEYLRKLNQSASDRVFHNYFSKGWAHGLTLLTEADPAARSLESFTRLPVLDTAELGRTRLQAIANPKAASRLLDTVELAGMRLAFEQIRALGPEAYNDYALSVRSRFPEFRAREAYYFDKASRDDWDL